MADDATTLPVASTGGAREQTIEAFGVLSNRIRLAILVALWDAKSPWEQQEGLRFSELYDSVEVDNSGQFNYHLEKLVPRFVDEDGERYTLTLTGFKIVQAVITGTGGTDAEIEDTAVDQQCAFCGEPVHVTYRGGVTLVYCVNCEGQNTVEMDSGEHGFLLGDMFPPAGLEDRTPTEVVDATVLRFLNRLDTMLSGVCPDCGGSVEPSLEACEDHDAGDGPCPACGRIAMSWVNCSCEVCMRGSGAPGWLAVQSHPAVVGFLQEHGVARHGEPWRRKELGIELGFEETLVSTSPLRVRIDIEVDGEALSATTDEEATVVEVGR